MKKKQIYSILSGAFYAIAVFQIADHGFTTLAIISMAMGTIMICLNLKEGRNNDGSN